MIIKFRSNASKDGTGEFYTEKKVYLKEAMVNKIDIEKRGEIQGFSGKGVTNYQFRFYSRKFSSKWLDTVDKAYVSALRYFKSKGFDISRIPIRESNIKEADIELSEVVRNIPGQLGRLYEALKDKEGVCRHSPILKEIGVDESHLSARIYTLQHRYHVSVRKRKKIIEKRGDKDIVLTFYFV